MATTAFLKHIFKNIYFTLFICIYVYVSVRVCKCEFRAHRDQKRVPDVLELELQVF